MTTFPSRWPALCRLFLLPALCTLGAATSALAAASPAHPATLKSQMHWRSIGPYIGGRVVAVSGVPGQRNLFYMGAVDGGVWKSTDYGIKWTNLTDKKLPGSSDSIGALAVAPSNPKVIYAGTGESDIRGDMISGDGVFRSDNGGKTWQRAGLADTHTIMGLVVDPHDAKTVYAASMGHVFVPGTHRGVFKSSDGGKTWKKVLFVNRHTGAVDLVMDPHNSNVLYATTWQAYRKPWKLSSGGPGSGLWKSTDGGAHWTNLTAHLNLPAGPIGKMGVSVSASDPQVVYTIVQAKGGGLFRSDDGGAHFHRVNHDWPLRQRAFYYMAVFTDPKDPDTVYVPMWMRCGSRTTAASHFASCTRRMVTTTSCGSTRTTRRCCWRATTAAPRSAPMAAPHGVPSITSPPASSTTSTSITVSRFTCTARSRTKARMRVPVPRLRA